MTAPTRPVLRYHGGKWRLAPWIISHFPPHRIYIEPFGGGASVLLRKARATTEIYNDLDGDVAMLFRVLRSRPEALARALTLTPYSRGEYGLLFKPARSQLERARRFVARSFMGMNSKGAFCKSGFDVRVSDDAYVSRLRSLAEVPEQIAIVAGRLTHVIIENIDALDLIKRHDRPDALFYLDPPYVKSTRSHGKIYRRDLGDADHRALAALARSLVGCVVLSGYPSDIYDELFGGWQRVSTAARADFGREATECLWLNPACVAALGHGPLFDAPERALNLPEQTEAE